MGHVSARVSNGVAGWGHDEAEVEALKAAARQTIVEKRLKARQSDMETRR
jgi:hypothetical protein